MRDVDKITKIKINRKIQIYASHAWTKSVKESKKPKILTNTRALIMSHLSGMKACSSSINQDNNKLTNPSTKKCMAKKTIL